MRHAVFRRSSFLSLTLALSALAACAGPDPATGPVLGPPDGARRAAGAAAATVRVASGRSIQAAVNAVGAHGTVLIEPGVYPESVVVTAPGVTLRGLTSGKDARVVIVNPGGANNGVRVTTTGDGFVLDNVTVRGFARNGVLLVAVDGFQLSRVRTENNGEYGLFPVRSAHGVIEECSATGHADTGIYVGQSSDVVIRKSVAWGNVAGFELENSTRVTVEHSEAYGNSVGVLVSLVPGLPIMTATENRVAHNLIRDNNLPNFGDPDDLAGLLPSGTGILVVGPDRVTVEHNTVTHNVSTGVAVVSASILAALAGLPDDVFGDVDPNSDDIVVQHNETVDNGREPRPPLSAFFPGVDLLWDGSGHGNCWAKNELGTTFPSPLPACK
jgi:parallel beta-helix repeat protein